MARSKHYRLQWQRVRAGWYRAQHDGVWLHVVDAEAWGEWNIYSSDDKYSTGGVRNLRGFEFSCRTAKWDAERYLLGNLPLSLEHALEEF